MKKQNCHILVLKTKSVLGAITEVCYAFSVNNSWLATHPFLHWNLPLPTPEELASSEFEEVLRAGEANFNYRTGHLLHYENNGKGFDEKQYVEW